MTIQQAMECTMWRDEAMDGHRYEGCIFCPQLPEPGEQWAEEHIIQAGIGNDNPQFILDDNSVCEECNTARLSRADKSLIDRLGLLPALQGVRTRSGQVSIIGNDFTASGGADGPSLVIDETDRPTIGTTDIGKGQGVNSIKSTEVKVENQDIAQLKFTVDIAFDQGLSRPLYKAAFEWAYVTQGREYVGHPFFDELRRFIRTGNDNGFRRYLVFSPPWVGRLENGSLGLSFEDNPDPLNWPVVFVTIHHYSFALSLAPNLKTANTELKELGRTLAENVSSSNELLPDKIVAMPRGDGKMEEVFRTSEHANRGHLCRVDEQVRRVLQTEAGRALLEMALDTPSAQRRFEITETNVRVFGNQFEPLLPGAEYDIIAALQKAHLVSERSVELGTKVPRLRGRWYRQISSLTSCDWDLVTVAGVNRAEQDRLAMNGYTLNLEPSKECLTTLVAIVGLVVEIRSLIRRFIGTPAVEGKSGGEVITPGRDHDRQRAR